MTAPLKKQKLEEETETETEMDTQFSTNGSKEKPSTKDLENDLQGEGKISAEKKPSREEMHAAVIDILKKVDGDTATLADVRRQLGEHFGVNLDPWKLEVQDIVIDVLENMSDDEDNVKGDGPAVDKSGKDDAA